MSTTEWKDEFVEQGVSPGAVEAKIGALLRLLAGRDLHPTKKQLSQVAACKDVATLDRWLDRAITAANAAEVFAD